MFNALVQLYKHKESALKNLEKVRINPDFSRLQIRADLEFFLPQLCSFYLNNELSEVEEQKMLDFMTMACS